MTLHPIPARTTAPGHPNRPRRARLALVALAAAATLGLTGCQTGSTDPGSDAATTPSASAPSSESTPSAESTGTDDATEPSQEPAAGSGTTTIEAPAAGQTVPGPTVTVTGTGTAFEGTLLYAVTDLDGATAAEGYTQAGANGEIGPFSIELTLDPGSYTVRVWEPGMGEGDASAPPVNVAEVAFSVS